MKKLVAICLCLLLLLGLSGCDSGWAILYTDDAVADNLHIEINKIQNCCFASVYRYDDTEEGRRIIIPDECNGIPVVELGGYIGSGAPTPFYISLECYMNTPFGSVYDDHPSKFSVENYTVEDVVFSLHIGKNVKHVEFVINCYFSHLNADGSYTFYHPVVEVTCSEENPYFYVQDGKLYEKATGNLVEDFDYASDV